MATISHGEQAIALAQVLKPLGFKKRRATWHRTTTDAIQTVNLQRSEWGDDYHLNVGTYLRALGEELTPPEYRCHVRSRIDPPDSPAEALVQEIRDWFEKFGTVTSLVAHSRGGTLPLTTTRLAKEWLDAA